MNDPVLQRIALGALAVVAVMGLGLVGWLAADSTPIPDVLVALPSAAVGAIGGLLIPTRGS